MFRILTFSFLLTMFLHQALYAAEVHDDVPERLQYLMNLRSNDDEEIKNEFKEMRMNAVKDVAKKLGIQEGAKWRYGFIVNALHDHKDSLDQIYGFRLVLIESKILPPVIIQSSGAMNIKDRVAVQTGTSYKIIRDARFVSNPPSWRDYLLQERSFEVQPIPSSLYPKDKEEENVWKDLVAQGWQDGIEQADSVFKINLRKLDRDFRGMILFRLLAGQGFLSLPQVSQGRYAVRVGNKTLDLNQTNFTIVRDSAFQQESKWKPFQASP